ncbi:MAG TPA: VTT domain-containing protein [Steroidobacteraceae bacterium]
MHFLVDTFLHLDRHLSDVIALYHTWIYGIVFALIFAETGLVVTPFLPGDSLLFAIGALAAVDTTGTLHAPLMWLLVCAAAILGNTSNYAIGRAIGPRAFSGRLRLLRPEHLRRTELFFARHGAVTVLLSRFLPLLRTFAPFVAGIGRMRYLTFQSYNIAGGLAWATLFIWGGFLFGNIPLVKSNFGLVTLGIIGVSLVPLAWALITDSRISDEKIVDRDAAPP